MIDIPCYLCNGNGRTSWACHCDSDQMETNKMSDRKRKSMLMIELGEGKKLVSDISGSDSSLWAGIAISDPGPACSGGDKIDIGEIVDAGADTVQELDPDVLIITHNPASLDVVISACKRAKAILLAREEK